MPTLLNPFVFGGAPAFINPGSLANCELWLEGDAIVGATNNVAMIGNTWPDQSGNGRTATPQASNEPVYIASALNGLPGVDCAGSWFHFASNFMSGFSAADVFFLYKHSASGQTTRLSNWSGNNDGYQPYINDKFYEDFGSTTRRNILTPFVSPTAAYRLYEVASGAGQYSIRQNNVSMFGSGTNTVSFSAASTPKLGHSAAASSGNTRIVAVIMYSRILTTVERSQVITYLNAKYGLSIGVGDDPNTNFWQNIAGSISSSSDSFHLDGHLQRGSGTGWNAGARSIIGFNPASSGGMALLWHNNIADYNADSIVGLAQADVSGDKSLIEYAIGPYAGSGLSSIQELGVWKLDTPSQVEFEIRIASDLTVTYWANNALIRTSPTPASSAVYYAVCGINSTGSPYGVVQRCEFRSPL